MTLPKLRRIVAGISMLFVVGMIIILIIAAVASAIFLMRLQSQTSFGKSFTSSTETSEIANSSTATTSFSIKFPYSGALLVSPDISAINYSATITGVSSSLTLIARAPPGLSAKFSSGNASFGSAILSLSSLQSTSPGDYQVQVEAQGNGFAQSENITVRVVEYLIVTIGTSFVPSNLTVTAGSNVTWFRLNGPLGAYDDGTHDIAFVTGASVVSPALAQYGSWSYVFSQIGLFDYYCKYHPFMKGEITVTTS